MEQKRKNIKENLRLAFSGSRSGLVNAFHLYFSTGIECAREEAGYIITDNRHPEHIVSDNPYTLENMCKDFIPSLQELRKAAYENPDDYLFLPSGLRLVKTKDLEKLGDNYKYFETWAQDEHLLIKKDMSGHGIQKEQDMFFQLFTSPRKIIIGQSLIDIIINLSPDATGFRYCINQEEWDRRAKKNPNEACLLLKSVGIENPWKELLSREWNGYTKLYAEARERKPIPFL
jgi:hypothetical protein